MMMMLYKQSMVILVTFMVTGITCTPVQTKIGDPHLETNIVFLSPGGQSFDHSIGKDEQGKVIIEPSKLLNSVQRVETPDVLEDPRDRFVTGRKGYVRPAYVNSEEDWAGEVSVGNKPLIRKKRCGGGGGGDDGGDANRSRSARRRRARAQNNRNRNRNRRQRQQRQSQRRAQNQTNTNQTTTKVIKVIEVPQGETIKYQPTVQQHKTVQAVAPQPQKQVVHTVVPQQQPIVHTVVPQSQQQPTAPAPQQQAQPVLVQQQPAQPAVVAAQPPVAAAVQPTVAAAPAVPSISVQGSVKVNSA